MLIEKFGWKIFKKTLPQEKSCDLKNIARITIENKSNYTLQSNQAKLEGFLSGKVLYEGLSSEQKPRVGDWIEFEKIPNEKRALIKKILPRHSTFFRKEKLDSTEKQILVTNIDKSFIIQGLDQDFNMKRLERYITLTKEGGSVPVIVLNKIDLQKNFEVTKKEVAENFQDIKILAISAEKRINLKELEKNIKPQETVVFIGSSGAGKSTIINHFLQNYIQKTKPIRESASRGRHTTTRRELFILPNGGIVIDTPGIREVGIVNIESLSSSFPDIENLMTLCKYTRCDHEMTEGCAVIEAIKTGKLSKKRYQNFLKLRAESERERFKKTVSFSKKHKQKQKAFSKYIRKVKKYNKKYLDF